MKLYAMTRRHLVFATIGLVLGLMLVIAGVQLATRNEVDTSQVQTGTKVSTVDTASDGQPTKLAFAQAISKQTADKNDPTTFTPSADKVAAVEEISDGWYIITLNVAGIDSDTTLALVQYQKPGTLTLKAGPGGYFYADWLQRDGVPDAVAQALVARNSDDH